VHIEKNDKREAKNKQLKANRIFGPRFARILPGYTRQHAYNESDKNKNNHDQSNLQKQNMHQTKTQTQQQKQSLRAAQGNIHTLRETTRTEITEPIQKKTGNASIFGPRSARPRFS